MLPWLWKILMLFSFGVASSLDIQDVVFVILSQNNKYNLRLAEYLESSIRKESKNLYNKHPVIHTSTKDFPDDGDWTILPLFTPLSDLHQSNASWVFFIQDYTKVRLKTLITVFQKYNHTEELWFGNALTDKVASIIHHFAFYEDPSFFKYPNFASGFAISMPLMVKLSNQWIQGKLLNSNFNIDGSYELSKFIWNDGDGPMLIHENALCSSILDEKPPHHMCITLPNSIPNCVSSNEVPTFFSPQDNLVPRKNIYFAVKTCQKFYKDRVPVVKNTWGSYTTVKFFSDTIDKSIPTIDLSIPNTETGHCAKTIAIIRYIVEEIKDNDSIQWIIIVDDDTILGVTNLQRILACYDPSEKVGLGERYGYELHYGGYNYITGGGGMVFSKPLLKKLAQNCECPTLKDPDDMFLGLCMARMGIEVTHSPGFHQARPPDYHPKFLEAYEVVSFHKHYMLDPVEVYKKWFEAKDRMLENIEEQPPVRNEL